MTLYTVLLVTECRDQHKVLCGADGWMFSCVLGGTSWVCDMLPNMTSVLLSDTSRGETVMVTRPIIFYSIHNQYTALSLLNIYPNAQLTLTLNEPNVLIQKDSDKFVIHITI